MPLSLVEQRLRQIRRKYVLSDLEQTIVAPQSYPPSISAFQSKGKVTTKIKPLQRMKTQMENKSDNRLKKNQDNLPFYLYYLKKRAFNQAQQPVFSRQRTLHQPHQQTTYNPTHQSSLKQPSLNQTRQTDCLQQMSSNLLYPAPRQRFFSNDLKNSYVLKHTEQSNLITQRPKDWLGIQVQAIREARENQKKLQKFYLSYSKKPVISTPHHQSKDHASKSFHAKSSSLRCRTIAIDSSSQMEDQWENGIKQIQRKFDKHAHFRKQTRADNQRLYHSLSHKKAQEDKQNYKLIKPILKDLNQQIIFDQNLRQQKSAQPLSTRQTIHLQQLLAEKGVDLIYAEICSEFQITAEEIDPFHDSSQTLQPQSLVEAYIRCLNYWNSRVCGHGPEVASELGRQVMKGKGWVEEMVRLINYQMKSLYKKRDLTQIKRRLGGENVSHKVIVQKLGQ